MTNIQAMLGLCYFFTEIETGNCIQHKQQSPTKLYIECQEQNNENTVYGHTSKTNKKMMRA